MNKPSKNMLTKMIMFYIVLSGVALVIMAYRSHNWPVLLLGMSSVGYAMMLKGISAKPPT